MKKQKLMTFTQLGLVALMTLAAAAASAGAQSFTNIRANIPFDFTVGDKTLPAGKYTIRRINPDSPGTLSIRSEDDKAVAVHLTNAVQTNTPPARAKLIFHRYGNSYFLSEVWADGDNTGRRLLKSRGEHELERILAPRLSQGAPAEKAPEIITLLIIAATP